MRVAVTGTPGTGKTTATDLATVPLEVVHLNDLIREEGLHEGTDAERDSLYADLEALRERLADRGDVLFESHLAHYLEADRVVVLRCRPAVLEERLRERGEPPEEARAGSAGSEPPRTLARKARENAESEALDVILSEAVERHGEENVYEVDTTDRSPGEVAREVERVVAGERAPAAGTVDFTGYL
ncbi:MAG: adenylate kinase family protein [Halobacteriaceae archaeon]